MVEALKREIEQLRAENKALKEALSLGNTYTYTCIHTHTHACIYTYMHTYMYIHT